MIDFFKSLAGVILSVINFIVQALQMFLSLLLMIPRAIGFIIQAVSLLPPFVLVIVSVMVAVSVILFVINKGSD